jgi:hypothetical protein
MRGWSWFGLVNHVPSQIETKISLNVRTGLLLHFGPVFSGSFICSLASKWSASSAERNTS